MSSNRGNSEDAQTSTKPLSTKLNRVSKIAKQNPEFRFKTLAHLITVELLMWAFQELRKNAAAGVDGLTAEEYAADLKRNIEGLHCRLKEGRYQAQPLRRVYIEKEDGKKRPLSIPVLEDKIAQRAVVAILNRIYERDFLDCSYGYRNGRGPHDAVNAIQEKAVYGRVNLVLEADIQDYFGTIVRKDLMQMLQKRIADKNILKLIGKWLRVGVIEDSRLLVTENGTYQGSVISPLLANIYLHEVLDRWMEEVVKPRLKSEVHLYRFADDFVICLQYPADATRLMEVLPKRFGKYGLTLHPKKTKLLQFGRFARERQMGRKPETFTFLGFTYYCSKTRNGKFTVKLKTASKRLRRSLSRIKEWCRTHRNIPVSTQSKALGMMMRGHYQYYGRKSNFPSLRKFYRAVLRIWQRWLSRRSNNGYICWSKFHRLLKKYPLPLPRITEGKVGKQLSLIGDLI
jgi:RNA-directed DNA polymerase